MYFHGLKNDAVVSRELWNTRTAFVWDYVGLTPHSRPNKICFSLCWNKPRFQTGNYGSRRKNERHMFGAASVCLVAAAQARWIHGQKCCLHTWRQGRSQQTHAEWSHMCCFLIRMQRRCHLHTAPFINIFDSRLFVYDILSSHYLEDGTLGSFERKSALLMVEFWQTAETDEYAT